MRILYDVKCIENVGSHQLNNILKLSNHCHKKKPDYVEVYVKLT